MFQSAYRKHHSTENDILRVCNALLKGGDHRKVNLLVLLDFSAAFGAIEYNILIKRLQRFYFRPFCLQCTPAFGSYYEAIQHSLPPACRRYSIILYGSVYPNKLPDLINRFGHCNAEAKTWMKVIK